MRRINIEPRPRQIRQNIKKPKLIWLPISALRIDDAYQRPILRRGWKQIEWIAENFNWASFTAILASRIDEEIFALIDGQHRTHAAYLAGYDEVPALVVEASQIEQALAFSSVNGRVTKITPHTVFKAALVAGEAWAVESDRVVSEAGCRLMRSNASQKNRKPGEVYAVSLIREMVANMEGNAVTAALKGLRQSSTGQESDVYSMKILAPWLKAIASNSVYIRLDLKAALNTCVDLYLLDEQSTGYAKETREPKRATFKRMICQALENFRNKSRAAA